MLSLVTVVEESVMARKTASRTPGKEPAGTSSASAVRARLLAEFGAGQLRRGQPVDSIRAIASRLGIGRGAAQKAIRSLVMDGICRAERGRGVFLAVDDPREVRASRLIGVVSGYLKFPLAGNPIYRQMFDGLDRWIVGEGHNALTLHQWRDKSDAQKARELGQFAGRLAGLVAVGVYSDSACILLRNTGLPLAVADYDTAALGIDCAVTDSRGAARLLAEAVAARGAERVFFVRWRRDATTDPAREERLEGLRGTLAALGRPLAGPFEMSGDRAAEETPALAPLAEAIRSGGARAAVICDDHDVVPEAMRLLGASGLAPGRDFLLGYVGPKPAPAERPAWPALVAAFDFEELGHAAALLLDRRIASGPGRPERTLVSAEILELVPGAADHGGGRSS
jgi:DNA-binding LacI/PurR family transcriptional regulator